MRRCCALWSRVGIGLIVAAWWLLLPGCAGVGAVMSAREQSGAIRDRLLAEAAHYEAAAEAARLAGDDAGAEFARLASVRLSADAATADAAVRQLDALLAESRRTAGDPAFQALSAVLPEPIRAPLLLGAAALAAAWRAHQLKNGLASVAESLDKAMRDDPELAARFKAQAPNIRSVQTKTAKRVIDEATRSETMLRLPL